MLYPPATARLIPPGANDPRIQPVGLVFHVAASKADSLYGYFNGPSGGIESHLYVRFDGTSEQYRDFEHDADAQNDGNNWISGAHRNGMISVETEGMGDGSWTDAQLATLADITRWTSAQYGFPIRMVPSPQPASPAQGGVGYHSLFPSWNTNDHACPGADRIKQIPDILAAAKGDNVTQDDINAVANRVLDLMYGGRSAGLVNQVRIAVQDELGDENSGAFSDRVASKVVAQLPPGQSVDALATAVADKLAARLKD